MLWRSGRYVRLVHSLRNHARTSLQLRLDGVVPLGQSFMAVHSKLKVQEADHPQEIEKTEEKGGNLPVNLVKLAEIAISPILGKGLAEFE